MAYPPQNTPKDITQFAKGLVVLERQGKGRLILKTDINPNIERCKECLWVYDIVITQCPKDADYSIVFLTSDHKAEAFDIWKNCKLTFRMENKRIIY